MSSSIYDALSIAYYIDSQDMGAKQQAAFLQRIYQEERDCLIELYRNNQRQFILDVSYWVDYLIDKVTFDKEYPAIQKDLQQLGMSLQVFDYEDEYADIDFYFMQLRLRIRYELTQGYTRIKLRTMLRHYGYKRRSPKIMLHISKCLNHFHLMPTQKGMRCDIWDLSLDEMITFKIEPT